jgi:hypothetical protein
MIGAIRGSHLEDMSWSGLGVTWYDLVSWLSFVQQCGGMAWSDSLHALLGGCVCGGAHTRPPAEGEAAFAPLRRVLSMLGKRGSGLDVVMHLYGDDRSFFARVEDGELMAWLEAEDHPRAWAGGVRASVAHHLLRCAGGADALRAAVSWLAVADWEEVG